MDFFDSPAFLYTLISVTVAMFAFLASIRIVEGLEKLFKKPQR
jgi:hypothetical protein